MGKVYQEVMLTEGWRGVVNTDTNAITVYHEDGRKATFSQEQIEKALASIIKQVDGNHFALVRAFANLSRQDNAISQATYIASCQCGTDKPYRKFIGVGFGIPYSI